MPYQVTIHATGSSGNAITIDNNLMIDAGLGYRTLKEPLTQTSALFITHRHGDHLNPATIKRLHKERPALVRKRLFINQDTHNKLIEHAPELNGVIPKQNILTQDWSRTITTRDGNQYHVQTYPLVHDVENQGFVITNQHGDTLIHATDTQTMKHAPKREYDYLLVEGNWDEDTLADMIASDDPDDAYRALRNTRHLSVQAFERFARTHSHPDSVIVQLHESMELGSRSKINTYQL